MAAVAAPLIAPPLDVSAASSRRERMLKTFEGYRDHFDAANERRERLIISSRQITALSKKAIFHIHRASLIPSEEGSSSDAGRSLRMQQLLDEAHAKIDEIKSWLAKVSEEIQSSGKGDAGWWQFARNVSPGLQEFLEAVSFLHYIEAKELISPEQLRERLADDAGHPVLTVPAEDYVLGISDLSGELMRYATNCSGSGNYATALHVCSFVRDLKAGLDPSQPFVRDLGKKQQVTSQSLEKIEKICYAIQLRILEYGDRPDVLARLAKRALEESQDDGGGEAGDDSAPPREGGSARGRGGGRGGRGGGASRGGRGGAAAAATSRPTEVDAPNADDGPPRKRPATESSTS